MENFPQFAQIAFVVEDLDAAVREFHRNFGIGLGRLGLSARGPSKT